MTKIQGTGKRDKVKRHFLPFEVETILNISLSYNLLEDSIIWIGNKHGIFFIKSAYYVALPLVKKSEVGECLTSDKTRFWKKMWQLRLFAMIIIFSWRACMGGLPTRPNVHSVRRHLKAPIMH